MIQFIFNDILSNYFFNITAIRNAALNDNQEILNFLFSTNQIEIYEKCFTKCFKLTQISIPPNVTTIKNETFSNCLLLKEVSLPSSLTSIGTFAFKDCKTLRKVMIPSSVISIGNLHLGIVIC